MIIELTIFKRNNANRVVFKDLIAILHDQIKAKLLEGLACLYNMFVVNTCTRGIVFNWFPADQCTRMHLSTIQIGANSENEVLILT